MIQFINLYFGYEWDEDREDWKQIGKWDFEKTKEESEDEIFAEYHVGFTVNRIVVNRYHAHCNKILLSGR